MASDCQITMYSTTTGAQEYLEAKDGDPFEAHYAEDDNWGWLAEPDEYDCLECRWQANEYVAVASERPETAREHLRNALAVLDATLALGPMTPEAMAAAYARVTKARQELARWNP